MPCVTCSKHGLTIAPHGCCHVARRVWDQQPSGHVTHVSLDGVFFSGWICDECLSTLNAQGLQSFLQHWAGSPDYPPEEELDPLLDLLDLLPMCPRCFEELSRQDLRNP